MLSTTIIFILAVLFVTVLITGFITFCILEMIFSSVLEGFKRDIEVDGYDVAQVLKG